MSSDKAKKYFLGQGFNCAQAVAAAFGIDDKALASCGSGRAPEGLCGAYYAAKRLIEEKRPEKLKELEILFLNAAGSLKCNEIRKLKKLSCLGCVEKAAEFISKNA